MKNVPIFFVLEKKNFFLRKFQIGGLAPMSGSKNVQRNSTQPENCTPALFLVSLTSGRTCQNMSYTVSTTCSFNTDTEFRKDFHKFNQNPTV